MAASPHASQRNHFAGYRVSTQTSLRDALLSGTGKENRILFLCRLQSRLRIPQHHQQKKSSSSSSSLSSSKRFFVFFVFFVFFFFFVVVIATTPSASLLLLFSSSFSGCCVLLFLYLCLLLLERNFLSFVLKERFFLLPNISLYKP